MFPKKVKLLHHYHLQQRFGEFMRTTLSRVIGNNTMQSSNVNQANAVQQYGSNYECMKMIANF
jgi:hypothetical protein